MKKREKVLLVLLAAIVILLGGYKFLIEPAIKNLSTAKEALVQAQQDKKQADDNVRRAESVKKDIAELEVKIQEAGKVFFPELDNDKVQIFFNGIAGKAGVSFSSFSMSPRTVAVIEGFSPVENIFTYPAKESADSIRAINENKAVAKAPAKDDAGKTGGDNGGKKAEASNAAALERMEVSLQFTADYARVKEFLDAVRTSERTVRVVSLNLTGSGTLSVSVSLECFGVKKITDDPLAKDTLPKSSGKANPFS